MDATSFHSDETAGKGRSYSTISSLGGTWCIHLSLYLHHHLLWLYCRNGCPRLSIGGKQTSMLIYNMFNKFKACMYWRHCVKWLAYNHLTPIYVYTVQARRKKRQKQNLVDAKSYTIASIACNVFAILLFTTVFSIYIIYVVTFIRCFGTHTHSELEDVWRCMRDSIQWLYLSNWKLKVHKYYLQWYCI